MTRLEQLEARRAQLNAQIAEVKAREARNHRARDTRRKTVLGSVVYKLVREGKISQTLFSELLAAVPARDKKLFEDGEPNAATLAAFEDPGEIVTLEEIRVACQ